ncbi:hypothetical protein CLM62_38755 [Streptomyces sp. SA15]|uniref:hypothetical protein n=1 Tax=Streptomyces sp. SA15 TaxID=934019 RepID=UPI000BB05047|nr:hypothetical protein [Streptomyces sp. SA15]PAZ10838.1 hypothetical protein CLM62_38755 [Streptomyces sp. SA15]
MNLDTAIQELLSALRRHAETVSTSGATDEALEEAFAAVRSAARRYSETVYDMSGHEGPFYDLELASADSEEDHEAEELAGAGPGDILRISGTWDFRVVDGDSWTRYVSQRLGDVESETGLGLSGDPAEAAAALLEFGEPWAWLREHGLESAGSEWSVGDSLDPLGEEQDE